jgi:hypothetical protein
MSQFDRDPWNPWTTSFAMSRVGGDPTGAGRERPRPTRIGFGVMALAWRRDERGAIERLPIEAVPVPNLRE